MCLGTESNIKAGNDVMVENNNNFWIELDFLSRTFCFFPLNINHFSGIGWWNCWSKKNAFWQTPTTVISSFQLSISPLQTCKRYNTSSEREFITSSCESSINFSLWIYFFSEKRESVALCSVGLLISFFNPKKLNLTCEIMITKESHSKSIFVSVESCNSFP